MKRRKVRVYTGDGRLYVIYRTRIYLATPDGVNWLGKESYVLPDNWVHVDLQQMSVRSLSSMHRTCREVVCFPIRYLDGFDLGYILFEDLSELIMRMQQSEK